MLLSEKLDFTYVKMACVLLGIPMDAYFGTLVM